MPKIETAESAAARVSANAQGVIAQLPPVPTTAPVAARIPQTGPAPTTVPGKSAAEQIARAGTGFSRAMKKSLGQS